MVSRVLAVIADRGQKVGHVVVEKSIADIAPVTAASSKAQQSEHSQLLRDDVGIEKSRGCELFDRPLDTKQGIEQLQSTRGRERRHRFSQCVGFAVG